MIGAERKHKVAVWSTSHTVPERNQARSAQSFWGSRRTSDRIAISISNAVSGQAEGYFAHHGLGRHRAGDFGLRDNLCGQTISAREGALKPATGTRTGMRNRDKSGKARHAFFHRRRRDIYY
jgi:hypothetical protein